MTCCYPASPARCAATWRRRATRPRASKSARWCRSTCVSRGTSELGNRFGILAVLLPVGIEHPLERLMTVRQRMLELKTSYEPAVTLGLFAALGYLPKVVQDQLFDLLLSRGDRGDDQRAGSRPSR